jgi:hypothetical protein
MSPLATLPPEDQFLSPVQEVLDDWQQVFWLERLAHKVLGAGCLGPIGHFNRPDITTTGTCDSLGSFRRSARKPQPSRIGMIRSKRN